MTNHNVVGCWDSSISTFLYPCLPPTPPLPFFLPQVVVGGDGGCGSILEHSVAKAPAALAANDFVAELRHKSVVRAVTGVHGGCQETVCAFVHLYSECCLALGLQGSCLVMAALRE